MTQKEYIESSGSAAVKLLTELDKLVNRKHGGVIDPALSKARWKADRGKLNAPYICKLIGKAARYGYALIVYTNTIERIVLRNDRDIKRYLDVHVTNDLHRIHGRATYRTTVEYRVNETIHSFRRKRRSLPRLDNFIKLTRLAGYPDPRWIKLED